MSLRMTVATMGRTTACRRRPIAAASPESWVRGSAALNPEIGWLSLTLELETDSPQAGPKGRLYVTLSKGCLHPVRTR
jgi:hypothetical protein